MNVTGIKRRSRNMEYQEKKLADLVQEFYNYANGKYGEHVYIYTDGSKEPITGATGAAVVIPSHHITVKRTSDHLSIYAVELCTILLAIEWVEDMVDRKIVISSDSVSSVLSKTHQEI